MNSKLYKLDLVDSKQEVCRPQGPGRGIQASGNDIIGGCCSGSQPRGSNHLGRRSRIPPDPPEKPLNQKCASARAAYPNQSAIPPFPEQPDQARDRNCCQPNDC